MNTLDHAAGVDALSDQWQLSIWLQEKAAPSAGAQSIQDLAWAVEFREALRDLVSGSSGGTPSPGSVEILDRAARRAAIGLRFGRGGPVTPDPMLSGIEGVVAFVLVALHAAAADGSWSRIKICRNPDCRRAYYDRSRNRSSVWCKMAACGNRMKVRRFRARRRDGGTRS